jgi:hypothetical protein
VGRRPVGAPLELTAGGETGGMTPSSLTRTRFPSAVLVAVGLAAGFGVAQGTGVRALGGAVFAVAGVAAGVLWLRRRGRSTALGLAALYVAAFVLAHVLAIGVGVPAWAAVSLVTLAAAGVTFAAADRPRDDVQAR